MRLYLELDPYPEVSGVIETLRKAGYATATLSNGSPKMLDAAVGSAGIHLDAVLSVEEVGIYKPDARVYQLAVDRLGVPADRICFVSSNAWDVAGAAHFGFKVAWCNRDRKRVVEGKSVSVRVDLGGRRIIKKKK